MVAIKKVAIGEIPLKNVAHFPEWGQTQDIREKMKNADNWETAILDSAKRFVVGKRVDGQSLSQYKPWAIEKAVVGEVNIKNFFDGSLLIETSNLMQAKSLVEIKEIDGLAVEFNMHAKLNQSKAVFRDWDMTHWDLEEMKRELASQKVIDIVNLKVKNTDVNNRMKNQADDTKQPEWISSPVFIFTFDLPERPQFIKIGYRVIRTNVYVPKPVRCFSCQRFGHVSARCVGDAVCGRCAEKNHDPNPCKEQIKCANCGDAHIASSKSCPIFKKEQKIQEIKVTERITYKAAKVRYESLCSGEFGKSYAEVSRNNRGCTTCNCECVGKTRLGVPPESRYEEYQDAGVIKDTQEESSHSLSPSFMKNPDESNPERVEEDKQQTDHMEISDASTSSTNTRPTIIRENSAKTRTQRKIQKQMNKKMLRSKNSVTATTGVISLNKTTMGTKPKGAKIDIDQNY
ncbi:uncharacterized protein LOC129809376 [Phlebotomus papatasi]|uniref:uncharacterized protein LOC129809376 n=1 Tax=Phlebotomus papatasi TaxID=29031 RepID=UPI0024833258|nr:uncharacterized protein LOC129809376 [Phlebotomus papatasi]